MGDPAVASKVHMVFHGADFNDVSASSHHNEAETSVTCGHDGSNFLTRFFLDDSVTVDAETAASGLLLLKIAVSSEVKCWLFYSGEITISIDPRSGRYSMSARMVNEMNWVFCNSGAVIDKIAAALDCFGVDVETKGTSDAVAAKTYANLLRQYRQQLITSIPEYFARGDCGNDPPPSISASELPPWGSP